MKLSTRCKYGTHAMIEIARHYKQGPVKRKCIAKNHGISSQYLENILIALKSHDLIRTIRGANGGFSLGTDPGNITMYEIVTALEGSITPTDSIESAKEGGNSFGSVVRDFWEEMYNMQIRILKETNLQSLLDRERKPTILIG